MKRIALILIAVCAFYAQADAMGDRSKNLNIFGSDDHQRKHHQESTVPVGPDRPVYPVPEPSSIFLIAIGVAAIAFAKRNMKG